jgi:hypothetical protein
MSAAVVTVAKVLSAVQILSAPKTLCLLQTVAVGHLLGTLASVPFLVVLVLASIATGLAVRLAQRLYREERALESAAAGHRSR